MFQCFGLVLNWHCTALYLLLSIFITNTLSEVCRFELTSELVVVNIGLVAQLGTNCFVIMLFFYPLSLISEEGYCHLRERAIVATVCQAIPRRLPSTMTRSCQWEPTTIVMMLEHPSPQITTALLLFAQSSPAGRRLFQFTRRSGSRRAQIDGEVPTIAPILWPIGSSR